MKFTLIWLFSFIGLIGVVFATDCSRSALLVPGLKWGHLSLDSSAGPDIIGHESALAEQIVYSCLRNNSICFNNAIRSPDLTLADLTVEFYFPYRANYVTSLLGACESLSGANSQIVTHAKELAGGSLAHLPDHFFDVSTSANGLTWGLLKDSKCTPSYYNMCPLTEFEANSPGSRVRKVAWACENNDQEVFDAALADGIEYNAVARVYSAGVYFLNNYNLLHLCANTPLVAHALPVLMKHSDLAGVALVGHRQMDYIQRRSTYYTGSNVLHFLDYSQPGAAETLCSLLSHLASMATTSCYDLVEASKDQQTSILIKSYLGKNYAGMTPLHYAAFLHNAEADPTALAIRTLLMLQGYTAASAAISSNSVERDGYKFAKEVTPWLLLATAGHDTSQATCAMAYAGAAGTKSLMEQDDSCALLSSDLPSKTATFTASKLTDATNAYHLAALSHDPARDPQANILRLLATLNKGADVSQRTCNAYLYLTCNTYSTTPIVSYNETKFYGVPPLALLGVASSRGDISQAICVLGCIMSSYCNQATLGADACAESFVIPEPSSVKAHHMFYFALYHNPKNDPTAASIRRLFNLSGNNRNSVAYKPSTAEVTTTIDGDSIKHPKAVTPIAWLSSRHGPAVAAVCAFMAYGSSTNPAVDLPVDQLCDMSSVSADNLSFYIEKLDHVSLAHFSTLMNPSLDPEMRTFRALLRVVPDLPTILTTTTSTYDAPLLVSLQTARHGDASPVLCLMWLALHEQLPEWNASVDLCQLAHQVVPSATVVEQFSAVGTSKLNLAHIISSHSNSLYDTNAATLRTLFELAGTGLAKSLEISSKSPLSYLNYKRENVAGHFCVLTWAAAGGSMEEIKDVPALRICDMISASTDITFRDNVVAYWSAKTTEIAQFARNMGVERVSPVLRLMLSFGIDASGIMFTSVTSDVAENVCLMAIAKWVTDVSFSDVPEYDVCEFILNNEAIRSQIAADGHITSTNIYDAVRSVTTASDPSANYLRTLLALGPTTDGFSTITLHSSPVLGAVSSKAPSLPVVDAVVAVTSPEDRLEMVTSSTNIIQRLDAYAPFNAVHADYIVRIIGVPPNVGTSTSTTLYTIDNLTYQARLCADAANYYFSYYSEKTCTQTCNAAPGWYCVVDPDSKLYYQQRPCPAPLWSEGGQLGCSLCQAGAKLLTANGNGYSCTGCDDGFVSVGETCTECPYGMTNNADHTLCVVLPGYYTNNGVVTACPAGFACEGGDAEPILCTGSTYAPALSSSCSECAIGSSITDVDSLHVDCQQCEPGHYSNYLGSLSCMTCPNGHYCPGSGTSNPLMCSGFTYAISGADSCSKCSADPTYLLYEPPFGCDYCPKLSYLHDGECQKCDALSPPYFCDTVDQLRPDRHDVSSVFVRNLCTADGYYAKTSYSCEVCSSDFICESGSRRFVFRITFDLKSISGIICLTILLILLLSLLTYSMFLTMKCLLRHSRPTFVVVDNVAVL